MSRKRVQLQHQFEVTRRAEAEATRDIALERVEALKVDLAAARATPAAPAAPVAPLPPPPPALPTPRQTYELLKSSNPYLAAEYLLNHQHEIYPVAS